MTFRLSLAAILLIALVALGISSPVLADDPEGVTGDCWACHRQANLSGMAGARTDIALCLDCHGDRQIDEEGPSHGRSLYVDADAHAATLHGGIACIACHADVARNPHRASEPVACADCHATLLVHANMGAPHINTDCAACHRVDLPVIQDRAMGRVMLASADAAGNPVDRTNHAVVTATGCDKCHVPGNDVGAPASVLPARSILCMICHDASPTVSMALFHTTGVKTDYASLIGLFIFGAGMVMILSLYLRGEIPGHPGLTTMQKLSYIASSLGGLILSRRVFRFLGGFVADGILLRRVLKESVSRWVMHALIFFPFLARFGLGLVTWLGQLCWPSAAWTQTLSNKDAPGVAFAYDFLTLLILLGVGLALYRRFIKRDRRLLTFGQDKAAVFLLGGILLVGILAEAIRLLSAHTPLYLAVYSFLGYGLGALLRPLNLNWSSIYPIVWYLHALLVVAFVAYLPFSKFMHILIGPLIVSLDAARKGRH